MVCEKEESIHSASMDCDDGGGRLDAADANGATSSASAGTAANSADDTTRERRRTQHQQKRQSWKMMRRDSDELNSYLAGDLAVGVRSREVDDDDSRSIGSSSTTSGGMLQQQESEASADFAPSSLPVTSIRQPTSGLSLTTHSSLSTSATADHIGNSSIHSVTRQMSQASEGSQTAGTGAAEGGASASSATPNNSVVSPRSPHAAHTPVAANNNVENTPPPTRAQADGNTSDQQAPATSSSSARMVRSSSGAAGSLITAQSAMTVDSWGFFDDHDPTIDTPGEARRKTSGGQAASTTPGGSSNNNHGRHLHPAAVAAAVDPNDEGCSTSATSCPNPSRRYRSWTRLRPNSIQMPSRRRRTCWRRACRARTCGSTRRAIDRPSLPRSGPSTRRYGPRTLASRRCTTRCRRRC